MSATLGTAARTRFLARVGDLTVPSFEEAERLAYSLLTVDHGAGAVAHPVEAPKTAKSVEVCAPAHAGTSRLPLDSE
jgi:hypothetical protein